MTFAHQLRAWRERQHLSQQALAERLRVSVATVSRWETGKRAPSPLALAALKTLGFQL